MEVQLVETTPIDARNQRAVYNVYNTLFNDAITGIDSKPATAPLFLVVPEINFVKPVQALDGVELPAEAPRVLSIITDSVNYFVNTAAGCDYYEIVRGSIVKHHAVGLKRLHHAYRYLLRYARTLVITPVFKDSDTDNYSQILQTITCSDFQSAGTELLSYYADMIAVGALDLAEHSLMDGNAKNYFFEVFY